MPLNGDKLGNLAAVNRESRSIDNNRLRNRNNTTIFVLEINLDLIFRDCRIGIYLSNVNFTVWQRLKLPSCSELL